MSDLGWIPQEQKIWCQKCKGEIIGPYLKAQDDPYHKEHFQCDECFQSLEQQPFVVVSGKLYCKTHAIKALHKANQSKN